VQEGAAEVLYGLGAVGNSAREAETSLSSCNSRPISTPRMSWFKVTIGELFEQMRQWERSGDVFSKVSSKSPYRTRSLLGTRLPMSGGSKTDDAIKDADHAAR
jgi:hypothetical protein